MVAPQLDATQNEWWGYQALKEGYLAEDISNGNFSSNVISEPASVITFNGESNSISDKVGDAFIEMQESGACN